MTSLVGENSRKVVADVTQVTSELSKIAQDFESETYKSFI